MRLAARLLLVALAFCPASAWSAPGGGEPHVGYLYPAGGRQGTTFQMIVGGQFLNGVNTLNISGQGVHASIVGYMRPLSVDQARELGRRLMELRRQKLNPFGRRGAFFGRGQGAAAQGAGQNAGTDPPVALPDFPMFRNLDKLSVAQLDLVAQDFRRRLRKGQINTQISETAQIEVTIDPGAAPGDREVRLGTPFGLTNPMRFQVGQLPEVTAPSPFTPEMPPVPVLAPPVLLNGQIRENEVDRFRVRARKGQHLVIQAQARALIPYLADAVPGWCQAVVTLYDAKGREVAYDDDYRFNPDPVLYYEVPEDGEYQLEVRDAIYRGRDDFVYRVSVAEQPFITRFFPLGGPAGAATVASIAGWNLPENRLALDAQPGPDGVRRAALQFTGGCSNSVPFAVDTLPERLETEPNNTVKEAQRVVLPVIINGIISRPGEKDTFRFDGRAGQEVVAEVYARRLGSPLDSLLQLTDASGRVLEWNDDHEDKESGLLTHQADSYLIARLPSTGTYFVRLSDAQNHGDESYGYRLRLGPPRPDFALRVTPSSINMPATGIVPITVHALRKDGFDGEIEVALKDAPFGFRLSGGRIPRGRESVRITLTAPGWRLNGPLSLHLEGRAQIGGATVSHPATPADDMMQAFAYRHLVPAQQLLVTATRFSRRVAPNDSVDGGSVRIPAGGSTRVRVRSPLAWAVQNVRLELSDPPKGLTLQDVITAPDSLSFVVKADGAALKPGYADNLIVEAFTEMTARTQNPKAANRVRRVSLGVLPAIPFEVVKP